MDSKANQQNETVVTIEAHCGSITDLKADESHHQLSEECLTVLAQGAESWEQQDGLSFDDALTKYVGECGKGQLLFWVAGGLLWVPNAVMILLMVFSLGTPIADKAWACRNPADATCSSILQNTDPAAVQSGFCAMDSSQWYWTDPGSKVVSRFGLVCGDAWKAQVANSFFFVGYFIGSGLFGVLSDLYGRKTSTFGASVLAAVFTAACIGATNYWALLALRLVTGIGVAGQALGAYLLSTEMIGASWRGVAGIITQVFFVMGEFALVIIAVALPSWRSQFAAGAVLCAASLLLWFLVPESGRWLQVQGRAEEAYQSLVNLSRLNGTRPPQEALAVPRRDSAAGGQQADGAPAPKKQGLGAALQDKHIARRFFVLAYAFLVMCMAYYGISFAVGGLGGSLVTSFSVAALAELPSYLLAAWAIERIGRHNTMAAGMLLGGAACIACAVSPTGAGQTILAAVGKFGIAASFAIASIYTSELFPTLIRSAVLGYQNQAARVGGIVAPFIVMASAQDAGGGTMVPFLTFGAASVLAALLIFTLPETLGVPLPDTMEDMENIASVFTHKTWEKGGLSAATKSMFKTHVKFVKPVRPAKQAQLPAVLAPVLEDAASAQPLRPLTPVTAPVSSSNSAQSLLGSAAGQSSAL